MDILDDMGVSKLSAKVFSKVNYSFKLGFVLNTEYVLSTLLMTFFVVTSNISEESSVNLLTIVSIKTFQACSSVAEVYRLEEQSTILS